MRNTLKHLTLLTRMKDDGLLPALTGSFSEDAIAQACGQVETLQLQERLHIWSASIQEMQSWSSLENVCWKGRLANGIGVHLDISVG